MILMCQNPSLKIHTKKSKQQTIYACIGAGILGSALAQS